MHTLTDRLVNVFTRDGERLSGNPLGVLESAACVSGAVIELGRGSISS